MLVPRRVICESPGQEPSKSRSASRWGHLDGMGGSHNPSSCGFLRYISGKEIQKKGQILDIAFSREDGICYIFC